MDGAVLPSIHHWLSNERRRHIDRFITERTAQEPSLREFFGRPVAVWTFPVRLSSAYKFFAKAAEPNVWIEAIKAGSADKNLKMVFFYNESRRASAVGAVSSQKGSPIRLWSLNN